MNFKEDFPSLKGKLHHGEYVNVLFLDDVRKYCIDKQRVKEAIDRLKIWIDNHEGYRPYNKAYDIFEKELGL